MEEFLSPEAARLVEITSGGQLIPQHGPEAVEYEIASERLFAESQTPPTQRGTVQQQLQPVKRQKIGDSNHTAGYLCVFRATENIPRRARYSNDRGKRVKEVRAIGACLRCRLLKKPCSTGNPCERCIAAAATNHSSRCLGWMQCIRPSLAKLNIFTPDPSVFQAYRSLGPTLTGLNMGIAIPFEWEIESMSAYIARWFITDLEPLGVSVVGIMSSAKFCSVLSQFANPSLTNAFRRLICATSILTIEEQPFGYQSIEEGSIKLIAREGTLVLRSLEAMLEPKALSQASQRKLGTIFIILVGTLIAIGYVSAKMVHFTAELGQAPAETHRPLTCVKRKELLRLLSHYLVYVGQKCLLLPRSCNAESAMDLASRKRPAFVWKVTIYTNFLTPKARRAASKIVRDTEGVGNTPLKGLIDGLEDEGTMRDVMSSKHGELPHRISNIKDGQASSSDSVALAHQGQTVLAKKLQHSKPKEQGGSPVPTTPGSGEGPHQSPESRHHKV
ncbi:MAG: hypothetical protein M1839_008370, partial [Geoglossum umbratile]